MVVLFYPFLTEHEDTRPILNPTKYIGKIKKILTAFDIVRILGQAIYPIIHIELLCISEGGEIICPYKRRN